MAEVISHMFQIMVQARPVPRSWVSP